MAPPESVASRWHQFKNNYKSAEVMRRQRTDEINKLRKRKRFETLLNRREVGQMDTDTDMDDPMDSSKPMEEDFSNQDMQYQTLVSERLIWF